ncbi:unnamed protein product [Brassica oleracea]|uniref:Myb/SANT-like DNA-binding domain-containing protein n=2 Tax=Brassica oleracea TaxID=3712 RepID=A0A0D3EHL1_BRAOL|nr:unnamed protein product [Brassica oleracea]
METTTPPPPPAKPQQPHSTVSHRQRTAGREDWWTEDATATLLQAWGHRFVRLDFGNLRQNDWKEVADAVNSSHGSGRPKTDTQCKSRIDTLKKKYKAEKAKLSPSAWRFFDRLDVLIGPVSKKPAEEVVKSEALKPYLSLTGTKYRESSLEDDDEEEEDGDWGFVTRKHPRVEEGDLSEETACKELARTIVKLGEVYERIEGRKQKMMVDLEKQRMEVVKEIELQRMNMLMEMQLELEKSKNRKRGDCSGKNITPCLCVLSLISKSRCNLCENVMFCNQTSCRARGLQLGNNFVFKCLKQPKVHCCR